MATTLGDLIPGASTDEHGLTYAGARDAVEADTVVEWTAGPPTNRD